MEIIETKEVFDNFYKLIKDSYNTKLSKNVLSGKNRLNIDFKVVSAFDPLFAEYVLDNPDTALSIAESVVSDIIDKKLTNFRVRFKNLPKTSYLRIRDIRSEHLNKLWSFQGIIRTKTDVRPQVSTAKFECPSCGNIMSIIQLDKVFKQPRKCGCGKSGKFILLDKQLIDCYSIKMEELPEHSKTGELKRLSILMKYDLSDKNIEERLYPGVQVSISGILKDTFKILRDQKQIDLDIFLDGNYVKIDQTEYIDIKFSKEDIESIIDLSTDPLLKDKLINTFFSGIYGCDDVKEGLLFHMFEGVTDTSTSPIKRGKIHILLIGEPGTAKSTFLQVLKTNLLKARYTSGKTSSGVGLSASVVRDELLGVSVLEPGVLPLANEGSALIDEIDKMDEKERDTLHDPMEGLTIMVDKANIHATLKAATSLVVAANPKYGCWDDNLQIYEQLNLAVTLINRFDLIYLFKDQKDKEHDRSTAIRQLERSMPHFKDMGISKDLAKKYIAYARKIQPVIDIEMVNYISDKFVDIKYGLKGRTKSIPITQRQVGTLARFAEASAKMRLSLVVTKQDVDNAFIHLLSNLRSITSDIETGTLDIMGLETGIPTHKRDKTAKLHYLLYEMCDKSPGGIIEAIVVIEEAKKIGMDEIYVENTLERMSREGVIFEPRKGFIKLM